MAESLAPRSSWSNLWKLPCSKWSMSALIPISCRRKRLLSASLPSLLQQFDEAASPGILQAVEPAQPAQDCIDGNQPASGDILSSLGQGWNDAMGEGPTIPWTKGSMSWFVQESEDTGYPRLIQIANVMGQMRHPVVHSQTKPYWSRWGSILSLASPNPGRCRPLGTGMGWQYAAIGKQPKESTDPEETRGAGNGKQDTSVDVTSGSVPQECRVIFVAGWLGLLFRGGNFWEDVLKRCASNKFQAAF